MPGTRPDMTKERLENLKVPENFTLAGVMGWPIAQSRSPILHNYWIEKYKLSGRYVPLATVVIAPVIINIIMYHAFVDTSGLPVAIFLVVANIFVAYYYRDHYKGLLSAK